MRGATCVDAGGGCVDGEDSIEREAGRCDGGIVGDDWAFDADFLSESDFQEDARCKRWNVSIFEF